MRSDNCISFPRSSVGRGDRGGRSMQVHVKNILVLAQRVVSTLSFELDEVFDQGLCVLLTF